MWCNCVDKALILNVNTDDLYPAVSKSMLIATSFIEVASYLSEVEKAWC